jgi:hypothetical protein
LSAPPSQFSPCVTTSLPSSCLFSCLLSLIGPFLLPLSITSVAPPVDESRHARSLLSRSLRAKMFRICAGPPRCCRCRCLSSAVDTEVAPRDQLGKFYCDSLVHDPLALDLVVKVFGASSWPVHPRPYPPQLIAACLYNRSLARLRWCRCP